MMITIYFNEEMLQVEEAQSVQSLLVQKNQVGLHFAVALNYQLLPRSHYSQTRLCAGDRVDVIVPMQGG